MLKSSLQLSGTASVLALAAALSSVGAAPAYAVNGLYAGGGTFAEKVYRDIMNCYGSSSSGELATGLASPPAKCNTAAAYNSSVELLYVGVGSGNGKKSWRTGNTSLFVGPGTRVPDNPPVVGSTDLGAFYGTGVGASWVPSSSDANKFPKVSFAGSDDPVTAADMTIYNSNSTANGWGAAIQVPAFIGPVGLGYNPASGTWNELGAAVAKNAHKLKLSLNTWCGIMTGHINDWNDAAITTDNGNVSLTGGASKTITVVGRSDGSGTTFIFTNALVNQCGTTSAPGPTVSAANAVPDSTNADSRGDWMTQLAAFGVGASGNSREPWVSANDFYDKLDPAPVGNCTAGHGCLASNMVVQPGNGGIKSYVNSHPGSIGYLSADFLNLLKNAPDPTGPSAANLQTYASAVAMTAPVYIAPTYQSATKVMTYSSAESTTYLKAPSTSTKKCGTLPEGCATNPLAWSKANPAPKNALAYPIAGFTFMDMYTCYGDATDVADLVGTTTGSLGYMRWYFGTPTENAKKVLTSLHANGFAGVPGSYRSGIIKLLITNTATKIGTPGQASTGCAAVTGPGA